MNKDTQRLVKWLLITILLIGSFLAIIFSSGSEDADPDDGGEVNIVLNDSEWIKGSIDAENVLVEYSDFQCPACASRLPVVDSLMDEFGSHVKFVYRHYPLNMHQHAGRAAQAAEAAGIQGKFWEMHDMIFEGQSAWSGLSSSEVEVLFTAYAESLSLDLDQFADDIDSSAVEDAVQSDANSGKALGVNSTPTFYLNNKKVTIKTGDYEQFRDFLREEIQGDSE
jgi:protein-disulfide isomerase